MVHRGATVSNNRRNPRAKWVLPDVIDPPNRICFKISVPNNRFHIAAFKGALYMLSSAIFWQDDTAHTAKQVARVWQDIFDGITVADCNPAVNSDGGFMEIDTMAGMFEPYCDENGKCRFHFKCDVCGDWHDVALVSDLATNPSGAGNQPPANGGVATYCKTVYANSSIIIPTPVSTGDKIEVTSADGDWSGTPFVWRCVDGSSFFITCIGSGQITDMSNFVPAAPTMSLIVQFSTGYYALYPGGSLIVPAGVTNEQPTLLANKPTLVSGSGQIDVCIKITNNTVGVFSHPFDMVTSPAGWSAIGTSPLSALWSPGIGWISQPGAGSSTLLDIQSPAVAGFTLTQVEVLYATDSDNGGGGSRVVGTPPGFTVYGALAAGAGVFDTVLTATLAGVTRVYVTVDRNGAPLGSYKVTKVIVSGLGADPF